MSTVADSSTPMLDRYGIPITHNNEQGRKNRRGSMTEEEERERRASIKAIMADTSLTPVERRRSIQGLMDGRRRSSCCGGGGATGTGSGAGTGAANAAPTGEFDAPSRRNSAASVSGSAFCQDMRFSKGAAPAAHSSLTAQQLAQTAAVQRAMAQRMERNRPPCPHYERNCTMIAPCCGLAFGCRICHDECPNLPPPLLNEQHKIEHEAKMSKYQRSSSLPSSFTALPEQDDQHTIDRFKVTEVICRGCCTRQSSKTNRCINCGVKFGEYHCSTCNLWMSAEEGPYHCEDCGFCRVGGRENFKHCGDCGMCIDFELFEEHTCKTGKYRSNCPVCQEDLFSSRAASHEMPCGHAIHWHCFRELAGYDSRCPICKKTAETPERMASTWSAMAMGIALQPVPPDMAKVVDIMCIDCEAEDQHRKWHFLGVQCRACSSFNTVVENIGMAGPEAASFLREHGDGGALQHQGQGTSHATHVPRHMASSINPGSNTAGRVTDSQQLYDPFNLGEESDDEMDMDDAAELVMRYG